MSASTENGKYKTVTTAVAQDGAGTTVDGDGSHYTSLIVMRTRTINDAFMANLVDTSTNRALALRNDP